VTALYIAEKPSEARRFAESSPSYKLNFLTRLLEVAPEAKTRYDDAFMEEVRKDAEAVKAKQKESICKECKQPKPQTAWTKASLDSMAREMTLSLRNCTASFIWKTQASTREQSGDGTTACGDRERVQVQGGFRE
jgi:hypothetical protein